MQQRSVGGMPPESHAPTCQDQQHRVTDPCESAPITVHHVTTSLLTAATPEARETLALDTGEADVDRAVWVHIPGAIHGPHALTRLIAHLQGLHAAITQRG